MYQKERKIGASNPQETNVVVLISAPIQWTQQKVGLALAFL